jgi:hypothetical protein
MQSNIIYCEAVQAQVSLGSLLGTTLFWSGYTASHTKRQFLYLFFSLRLEI